MSTSKDAMSAARVALADRGFVVFERLLEPHRAELMDLARRLIEAGSTPQTNEAGHWNEGGFLFEGKGSEKRLYKIQGVCLDQRFGRQVLEKLFGNARIVEMVRELFGSEAVEAAGGIDVFGTKFFPVWEREGRSVGWHQDSHYFGSQHCDGRILSFGIYLEDSTKENGCLRVVPGSHRARQEEYPHLPGTGEWAQGEWINDELVLSDIAEEAGMSGVLDVEVPACSVVVFDAKLVHGAGANRSETRTRFSFFGHFVRGDANFAWRGIDFSRGKYADRHCILPS